VGAPKEMKIAMVPNLTNIADWVTPLVLNPGSASRLEVGRCHVADTHQTTNRGVLFELLVTADSEAHHCAFHCP
jgi:hypothetical protein